MRKNYLIFCLFIALIGYSCKDHHLESSNHENSASVSEKVDTSKVTIQASGLLKFESKEQLQNVIDKLENDSDLDLRSKGLLKKLGIEQETPKMSLRALQLPQKEFISLYDENYEKDLKGLSPSDWAVINSDPDKPVYVPEDQLIEDVYLTSVLNVNREIQVDKTVYKFTEAGIYMVDVQDYDLLSNVSNTGVSKIPLSSKLQLYIPPTLEELAPGTGISSPPPPATYTMAGTSLKLADNITIPASNIRDINFNNTDANFVTMLLNKITGHSSTAINTFRDGRKMLTHFYDENYLIYKKIGVTVKMQKRLFGIWFNINSQDMRVGWYNIEIKENLKLPNPFASIPQPVDMTPNLYPNLKIYEPNPYPAWLRKNFPFVAPDENVMFPIPFTQYELTLNSLINIAYSQGLSYTDKTIKAYMKAHNLANTPMNAWLYTVANPSVMRYIISPKEVSPKSVGINGGASSMDFKFLSEWFTGTYEVGFATDPFAPNFKSAKYAINISGNSTSLARGIVYGAVKFENQWRAARIVKVQ